MTLRIAIRYLFCVLLFAAIGCGPSRRQNVERATESEPYDFRAEGELPPPERVTPEADIEESAVADAPLEFDEADVPIDTTSARPVTVDGFRVQLFASLDKDAAQAARFDAEQSLSMTIYIDVIDRMFKVRVGDCLTRECAEALMARCRASDYPDAWIVASRIVEDRAADGPAATD